MARWSAGDERQHEWYLGPDWSYEWDLCRCCEKAFDVALLVNRYCRACAEELERDRQEWQGQVRVSGTDEA